MPQSREARAEFILEWRSRSALHRERLRLRRINFWRDIFPGGFGEVLPALSQGEEHVERFEAGVLVPPWDERSVRRVPAAAVPWGEARVGRFYARGILGLPDMDPEDRRPVRVVAREGEMLHVDFNHPLARYPLTLGARILETFPPREERGGFCHDVGEAVTHNGPGMQAPLPDRETDFHARGPALGPPAAAQAADPATLALVSDLHARYLEGAAAVLDLMSAVAPPLPAEAAAAGVTALRGPDRGPASDADVVARDPAEDPRLPLPDRSMDACVCCLGADALPRPADLLAEVGRVLKPGAPLVLTFTDPPAGGGGPTPRPDLYPFERLGLLLQTLEQSGRFRNLESETVRGYPLAAAPPSPLPATGALFAVAAAAGPDRS